MPQNTKETAISKDQQSLSAELFDAARSGDASRVRSLLAAGADPNARGLGDKTPLHCVTDSRVDCAAALIAAGADPNAQSADGWTPIYSAVWECSEKLVNFLIAAGADLDIRTNEGVSPLHWAALKGSDNFVKALLASGADPNAQNEKGLTPLHYAASSPRRDRNINVVKALLAAGADPNTPDNRGRLAKEWAPEECRSVLEEAEILACLPPAKAGPSRSSL